MSAIQNGDVAEIHLTFRVHDADLLLELARDTIEQNGMGHEFDPTDAADCIVELLLHSNPDISGYMDYGIECLRTK